jgi:hypothetical protein
MSSSSVSDGQKASTSLPADFGSTNDTKQIVASAGGFSHVVSSPDGKYVYCILSVIFGPSCIICLSLSLSHTLLFSLLSSLLSSPPTAT